MRLKTFESHGISDDTEHATLQLKKILVPIDFSPASTNAVKYALRLGEEFAAELTLLYVLAPAPSRSFASIPGAPAFSESDLAGTEKNLRALIASTRNGSVQRVRSTIRIGVPSHEIVEMAKDANSDLIVIATHGYTGWKHFCIGSTAERVVRAAPCPVLVVREKEHDMLEYRFPEHFGHRVNETFKRLRRDGTKRKHLDWGMRKPGQPQMMPSSHENRKRAKGER